MGFAVRFCVFPAFVALALFIVACGQEEQEGGGESLDEAEGGGEALTIYSGRTEEVAAPVIEQFEEETGIDTEVRYGDTADLTATILEEGENSPADVFFVQEPGALGALSREGRLTQLPQETLEKVEERFRSPEGEWSGSRAGRG